MTSLSDETIDHLLQVSTLPDLAATKYEVLETLGSGGMGTVFLARDRELQREVALKVLASMAMGPGTSDRLLSEARILAHLEHPGIVPIHDLGRLPDGRLFYVMKRVKGSRLDEHARQLESTADALRLFERICEPVAFAHAGGVIHRDLKPENVMVGPFGEVLVMDWGVARFGRQSADSIELDSGQREKSRQTAAGAILGTPGYMAPEQAGGASDLDERADIYALGAILRFLLTGEAPPIAGEAGGHRAHPPDTRRWSDRIPRPIEAICRKAMAIRPENRYSSVPEMSADVARFLTGGRVLAYPESLPERTRRFAARHRTAIVLIAVYLAVRLSLILWRRS